MIDKQGYLKLIDFGYSKIINNLTYTFCGTPHYMAPEIVSNKGHSFESDYWSLGIVLFEMLTGEVPFNYSDPIDIY
jgi:serine/threonine protein kinase